MYKIIVKCYSNNGDTRVCMFYEEFIEFGDLGQVINFIQLYEHHAQTECEYTISYVK
jgi:hypothetical protein